MAFSVLVILFGILSLIGVQATSDKKDFLSMYGCSFCLATMDAALENISSTLLDSCLSLFPEDICRGMKFPSHHNFKGSDSRGRCRELNHCPENSLPVNPYIHSTSGVDIRVSKAMGSRGYDKARVSVVSNHSVAGDIFDYNSQFKYRWTDKFLSSGIVSLTQGQTNKFTIAGQDFSIYLPKDGEGVRGVIVADPCFQSEWIICLYQKPFEMFDHFTALLNAAFSHEDVHYWQILGDNFYDQQGEASTTFFEALTDATKGRFFATVPGNHDFWVNSSPELYVPKDQLGNGFMQFYGQDVIASTLAGAITPYDFTADPDGANKSAENLPAASNFFFYNKVGNVAFIGYSGAHSFASMQSYFQEACDWAQEANPDVLLLLGHWNNDNDGCDADTTVPAIYSKIASIPSCSAISSKIRYFMGHKHCNEVTDPNVGFMVGGMGMSDAKCGGSLGIPVVDTTDGSFKVYYFEVQQAPPSGMSNNYDEILSCFQEKGVSNCYHLAQLWANVPL